MFEMSWLEVLMWIGLFILTFCVVAVVLAGILSFFGPKDEGE